MKNRRPYRQGDILLIPTDAIPHEAKNVPARDGRLVLAEGEATGHAHTALGAGVELLSISGQADLWLRSQQGEGIAVLHDEHGTIVPTEREFIVRRQREYTPQAIRRMAD